ncbi:uncharacterized protein C8A04DRAFT_13138 [Dichotomopilus funicola]|uniref:Uncharacterized protein n=1 Tax=Dichotomopilus funicola TaxID=1934379 RepID=A0AAN6V0M3_9PEZI|nr:hypothetical protein C8A04DRAFT_13138 [Dichotomopilus funicola]
MATLDLLPDEKIYDEGDEVLPGLRPHLDAILSSPEGEDIVFKIAAMLKEYLLPELCGYDKGSSPTSAEMALRFDNLYEEVYLPLYNGFRGKHKGWTGYLCLFYSEVFEAAFRAPYDDPAQTKVVELLQALRDLPGRTAKVFLASEFSWVDSEIWSNEILFGWELSHAMPYTGELTIPLCRSFPYFLSGLNLLDFNAACARWVSAAALSARCTSAGFNNLYIHCFPRIGYVLTLGLEPGFPSHQPTKLDCYVMAAAQYILLAGATIDENCVRNQLPFHRMHRWKRWADGNGPNMWRLWGDRFAEIAQALDDGVVEEEQLGFRLFEQNRAALREMVGQARERMVELEPALFEEGVAQIEKGEEAETTEKVEATGDAENGEKTEEKGVNETGNPEKEKTEKEKKVEGKL